MGKQITTGINLLKSCVIKTGQELSTQCPTHLSYFSFQVWKLQRILQTSSSFAMRITSLFPREITDLSASIMSKQDDREYQQLLE